MLHRNIELLRILHRNIGKKGRKIYWYLWSGNSYQVYSPIQDFIQEISTCCTTPTTATRAGSTITSNEQHRSFQQMSNVPGVMLLF